jgi:hypothetical protein
MEQTTTSKLDPRPLLAIVAVVLVATAIWAATALAGGGSSGGETTAPGSGRDGSLNFVQDAPQDGSGARGDCPDGGARGGSSEPDGSSSPDV